MYIAYTFFEKNIYCIKLYFEFGCLVFHQFLLPQPKNRSRAYMLRGRVAGAE